MSTLPRADEKQSFYERPAFLYLLITLVIFLASGYFGALSYFITASEKRGEFGDAFGAINAVFTGLAFAAVIYGIILQRKEIRLQQRELFETRQVFQQQSFETLFFNVQRVLAETVAAIEWKEPATIAEEHPESFRGRRALKAIAESVYQQYFRRINRHAYTNANQQPDADTQLKWLLEEYSEFYWMNESLLGNYFRLVYNVLKLVSESDFTPLEKERYAHLFRAQLSEGELTLLVLNGMVETGEKLRRYLEEFAMLKHATMEGRNIPKPRDQYKAGAFFDLADRATAGV